MLVVEVRVLVLSGPTRKLRGKGGHPIDVTARVKFTVSADGRYVVTPVFVQPDSEQKCLLGSNVLHAMGITVTRANGEPLTAAMMDDEPTVISLRLPMLILCKQLLFRE